MEPTGAIFDGSPPQARVCHGVRFEPGLQAAPRSARRVASGGPNALRSLAAAKVRATPGGPFFAQGHPTLGGMAATAIQCARKSLKRLKTAKGQALHPVGMDLGLASMDLASAPRQLGCASALPSGAQFALATGSRRGRRHSPWIAEPPENPPQALEKAQNGLEAAERRRRRSGTPHPSISAVTWAATERARPSRS